MLARSTRLGFCPQSSVRSYCISKWISKAYACLYCWWTLQVFVHASIRLFLIARLFSHELQWHLLHCLQLSVSCLQVLGWRSSHTHIVYLTCIRLISGWHLWSRLEYRTPGMWCTGQTIKPWRWLLSWYWSSMAGYQWLMDLSPSSVRLDTWGLRFDQRPSWLLLLRICLLSWKSRHSLQ